MATRFWADVRFVFRNSGKLLRASPSVRTLLTHPPKTNGLHGVMFQRAYSSCRFSASSPSRNFVTKYGRPSHRRWLATYSTMGDSSYDPSWEDEALEHMFSSPGFSEPSKGVSFIHDEALRAASPLRSPAPGLSSPRFDWRRRATSRAPHRGNRHGISRDGKHAEGHVKRLMPQQHESRPGGRFYREAKAYEDRWVLASYPEGSMKPFPSQVSTLARARASRGGKGNARKISKVASQATV